MDKDEDETPPDIARRIAAFREAKAAIVAARREIGSTSEHTDPDELAAAAEAILERQGEADVSESNGNGNSSGTILAEPAHERVAKHCPEHGEHFGKTGCVRCKAAKMREAKAAKRGQIAEGIVPPPPVVRPKVVAKAEGPKVHHCPEHGEHASPTGCMRCKAEKADAARAARKAAEGGRVIAAADAARTDADPRARHRRPGSHSRHPVIFRPRRPGGRTRRDPGGGAGDRAPRERRCEASGAGPGAGGDRVMMGKTTRGDTTIGRTPSGRARMMTALPGESLPGRRRSEYTGARDMATTTKPRRTAKMGRKRTPPPPKQPGDPWNLKLARLIERKGRGRTDAQIADAAGITPAYLSRLLSGSKVDPQFSTVLALLDALDATLCDLHRA